MREQIERSEKALGVESNTTSGVHIERELSGSAGVEAPSYDPYRIQIAIEVLRVTGDPMHFGQLFQEVWAAATNTPEPNETAESEWQNELDILHSIKHKVMILADQETKAVERLEPYLSVLLNHIEFCERIVSYTIAHEPE